MTRQIAIVRFMDCVVLMPDNILRWFNKDQLRKGKPMLEVLGYQPTCKELLEADLDVDPAIKELLERDDD